jgi:hypothetical protein
MSPRLRGLLSAILAVGVALPAASGCSRSFVAGSATGAAGAGALYEYSNKRQLDDLERAYQEGQISRDEYLRRRHNIESRSVVY